MPTADALSTYLADRRPGQKLRVELRDHDGNKRTVEVSSAEHPERRGPGYRASNPRRARPARVPAGAQ